MRFFTTERALDFAASASLASQLNASDIGVLTYIDRHPGAGQEDLRQRFNELSDERIGFVLLHMMELSLVGAKA